MTDPALAYRALLGERWMQLAAEERRFRRVGNLRLGVFLAGLVLLWLVVSRPAAVASLWLLLPAGSFVALVLVHQRVFLRRERARRAVAFYQRGIARLEHRWMNEGEDGARFRDSAHLYADDLECFGPGSLFQLLCTARTGVGQATLARWLLAPADPELVQARQGAVQELRPGLDSREDLAVLGVEASAGLDSKRLGDWVASPPVSFPAVAAWGLPLLGLLAFSAVVGSLAGPLAPGFALAALAAASAAVLPFRSRVRRVLAAVDTPARDLGLLAALLERLERESYTHPLLVQLRRRLDTSGDPASREAARLRRLIAFDDSRRNQLFAPIAALLLLGTQLAMAIERWRVRVGPAVVSWVEVVGELEALGALASHAYEHPADAFPRIEPGPPHFEAEGLGHPLLPESGVVRNAVRLGGGLQALVVSGSNMSGKSTFLKAVGCNAVLAQAGAPVRAGLLRMSPLAVGASLLPRESLLQKRSRFYAEILRVREIVAATGAEPPVLFLLDELLSGTNSHDRAIGAGAILRRLVDAGAIGMVTTHDLALARLADQLAPLGANVHFEDQLVDGEVHFDYRLREGVVTRSNALELMRSVGLDVEGENRR